VKTTMTKFPTTLAGIKADIVSRGERLAAEATEAARYLDTRGCEPARYEAFIKGGIDFDLLAGTYRAIKYHEERAAPAEDLSAEVARLAKEFDDAKEAADLEVRNAPTTPERLIAQGAGQVKLQPMTIKLNAVRAEHSHACTHQGYAKFLSTCIGNWERRGFLGTFTPGNSTPGHAGLSFTPTQETRTPLTRTNVAFAGADFFE
jgi:hypothetical protein